MLEYSRNSKNYRVSSPNQLDFQPIIINNSEEKQKYSKKYIPPKQPQKTVVKTTDYFNPKKSTDNYLNRNRDNLKVQQYNRAKSSSNINKQWSIGAQKTGVFDKNLKVDMLAQQERRLRAQIRKKTNSKHSQSASKQQVSQEFYMREEQINRKQNILKNQKDTEIEKLKRLVQQQRIQKEKSDRIFQQKKRQLENQRKKLIKIQQDIQKNGPKRRKIIQKQAKLMVQSQIPSHDRPKCHQTAKQYSQAFAQPTQSEFISNQRNKIRQGQIASLMKQRQACLNAKTLNYSPTLIPLISRASYKIISTHISTLVELLIDDLLEQQIDVLQQIQAQQRQAKQKGRKKEVLYDYEKQLQDFVNEAQEIEYRMGKYSSMEFQDVYKPRFTNQRYEAKFEYQSLYRNKMLSVQNLGQEVFQQIHSRSDRFKRFTSSFDEYKKNNLEMFGKCTQQIINEAITRMAEQLDRGSGDFVDLIFRNQFK